MKYEYKAQLIALQLSQSEVRSGAGAQKINAEIKRVMEHFTELGFEYHNQITLPTTVNPGCLAGLLGAKATTVDLPVLVFRKPLGA